MCLKLVDVCFRKKYRIIINSIQDGMVKPNVEKSYSNRYIELLITPNKNYTLDLLLVCTESGGWIHINEDNTFLMPSENVYINATFKPCYEGITVEIKPDYPENYVGTNLYEGYTFDEPTNIQDEVLVYFGGKTRFNFTPESFTPWVAWKFDDGKMCWTYDGFTFLELDLNGKSFWTRSDFDETKAATKETWTQWLDKLFSDETGLKALDDCIENLKTILGEPPFKHYVNIMIPDPLVYQDNWGELDGEIMDFRCAYKYLKEEIPFTDEDLLRNLNNRKKAIKWYIDEVIRRFNSKNYRNIYLNGFYWLEEDNYWGNTDCKNYDEIHNGRTSSFDLMAYASDYIHSLNGSYQHLWYPYLHGGGSGNGFEGHFDHVSIQTGYTIDLNLVRSFNRVVEAINRCAGYAADGSERQDDHSNYRMKFLIEFLSYSTTDYWPDSRPEGAGQVLRDRLAELELHFTDNNLWDHRFGHTYYPDGKFLHWVLNRKPLLSESSTDPDVLNEKFPKDLVITVDKIMKHIVERHNIIYDSCPTIE